jgi:uncharacterized membrane protein
MLKLKRNFCLILTVGVIYLMLEVFFRAFIGKSLSLKGWSSLWMIPIGGISIYLVGLLNERYNIPIKLQSFIGAFLITVVELGTGYILNIKLKFGLWNYSDMPLNYLGQICLIFSFIWYFIMPIGIWLDDVLRYYIFDDFKPICLSKYYKKLLSFKWE